ncbi:hypothetical protein FH039_05320 [Thermococcus indicus]|uniref:Uncharacterized protein n=1 Tax=Thermococcus indicus TaxID=2586643 RepID=A0A4Y5SL58_9EURY|nr:hypothetical protein [Thermococcus indicus]QDA31134.1 hypothetical protein FH039_05320 [Thermococcus indicus]
MIERMGSWTIGILHPFTITQAGTTLHHSNGARAVVCCLNCGITWKNFPIVLTEEFKILLHRTFVCRGRFRLLFWKSKKAGYILFPNFHYGLHTQYPAVGREFLAGFTLNPICKLRFK